MKKQGKSPEWITVWWKFFASIRLSVVILLSLAATSVIGTLVPQNQPFQLYIRQYGELIYRIFFALDLTDMYHSWWFLVLLFSLAVNIVICSIDRLRSTWKIIFPKTPLFSFGRFEKSANQQVFDIPLGPDELRTDTENDLSRRFAYCRTEELSDGFRIFAEKGRWTRLGVYIVHVSVLLLLLGGSIGAIYGFDGYLRIKEGGTTDTIQLKEGGTRPLGFELRCDDFSVTFYPTGTPKEYRSDLTVIELGRADWKRSIIVNDPMRHKGISLFQSSYQESVPTRDDLSDREIDLVIENSRTKLTYVRSAKIGDSINLPENTGRFMIRDFIPSYLFKGVRDIGACFIGVLTNEKGESGEVVLPVRFPSFDRMRGGDFVISVKEFPQIYYTVLSVRRDPGVPLVYAGFLFMIVGFVITFFLSHQRICVWGERTDEGCRVSVAGLSNKNRIDIRRQVERIAGELKKESPENL